MGQQSSREVEESSVVVDGDDVDMNDDETDVSNSEVLSEIIREEEEEEGEDSGRWRVPFSTVQVLPVCSDGGGRDIVRVLVRLESGMFVSGGDSGSVILWDGRSGGSIVRLSGHRRAVMSAVYYMSGCVLITASADRSIRWWDVSPSSPSFGTCTQQSENQCGGVLLLVLSDTTLVSYAANDTSLRLWDAGSGIPCGHIPRQSCREDVHTLLSLSNGRVVVVDKQSTHIGVYNVVKKEWMNTMSGHERPIHLLTRINEDMFASASQSGDVSVWNSHTLTRVQNIRPIVIGGSRRESSPSSMCGVSGARGKRGAGIAVACGHSLCVCDAMNGRVIVLVGEAHEADIAVLEVCGRGKKRWLVSAGEDGVVRVWDLFSVSKSGDRMMRVGELRGHTGGVRAAEWVSSGVFASGGADGLILLWRHDKLEEIRRDAEVRRVLGLVTPGRDG